MTLRTTAITTALVVLLGACAGSKDEAGNKKPQGLLDTYRKQRSELDEKIKALEQKLGMAGKQSAAVPVTVVTPGLAPFEHMIAVKATVDSRSSVSVAPKSSGQLVSLLVTEGQAVQKGQLLAQLDAEIIQRGLDEVTTQLEFAQVIYDKQQRIYQQKAGSEIQYLQAKNNKESLEKRLASLKEQLELTKIKAPTSGFVDGLKPTNGEMVMAGMPMMTIVNTSDMRVIADLSESYVSTVGNGDPAQISFPEIGETLRTKVGTVSKSVNPVNRTFRVEIPIRPVPAGLRPNTTCDLQINDNTVPNAIAVPLEAVVREDNRTYAYVLKDNVAQRRAIETGLVSGASVQILNGIQAREQVVVRGATTLADGQRVRIIE